MKTKEQVLTFPRESFDIKKFIARQKEIADLRRAGKITIEEYVSRVYQTKEKRKRTIKYRVSSEISELETTKLRFTILSKEYVKNRDVKYFIHLFIFCYCCI